MDAFFDPRNRGRLWVVLGNQPGVGISFVVKSLASLWRRSDETKPEQEMATPGLEPQSREADA